MATETKREETRLASSCCGVEIAPAEAAGVGDGLVRLATVFKALSDETRLRILRSLMRSEGPLCECEIVPAFGLSQSTISYHLKVLREAGLVEADRRGVWAYYRLSPKSLLGVVRELTELA